MFNSTTDTYSLKREIINFSKKISEALPKPDQKFYADMIYGILASGSCLLTDIVDQLHESVKKVNAVERLSKHLKKGTSGDSLNNYLNYVCTLVPD